MFIEEGFGTKFGQYIAMIMCICKADIVCAEHQAGEQCLTHKTTAWEEVGSQGGEVQWLEWLLSAGYW